MNDNGPATLARSAAHSVEQIQKWERLLATFPTDPQRINWREQVDREREAISDIEQKLLPNAELRQARFRAARDGDDEYVRIFDAELQRRGLTP